MDKALYDRGMTMRRRVLGDEYVDRAVANTDDFNRQFQELLTTYCWGAVWGDDALKPRDRSILNLGMIACLGRMLEFEAHFRGHCAMGLRQTSFPLSCGRWPFIAGSRPPLTVIAWRSKYWLWRPKKPDPIAKPR